MRKMVFATKKLVSVIATRTKKADSVIAARSAFGISRHASHADVIISHNLVITLAASVIIVLRMQRENIAISEFK